jgi:iron complex outermembrane receptor protein
LEDKSNSLGLRLHINFKDALLFLPFEWSFGTELATENYRYSLYRNLYLSQPGQGSIQGNKFSAIEQNRNYSNYFMQFEIWLLENLHLETGIALNTTTYSLDTISLTTAINQNSNHDFGSIWSPRIGLSYKVGNSKNIYTSVSKGFSVPTVAESLTPDGQINTNLQPETGWNYEVGFKGNWFKNKLYTELSFFSTQIQNLLVARRTGNDQYIGINAGSSSHPGIEATFNYRLMNWNGFQITPYFAGTINNFKFKDFIDREANYSGNELTGVPDKQWSLGLDIASKKGFTVNFSYRTIGKIPMNDSNTKYSDAFSLLDIKTTYACTFFKVLRTEVNAGVNNALDDKYASSVLPNAVAFGAAQPRYYYPGDPVNYYGSFSLSYTF